MQGGADDSAEVEAGVQPAPAVAEAGGQVRVLDRADPPVRGGDALGLRRGSSLGRRLALGDRDPLLGGALGPHGALLAGGDGRLDGSRREVGGDGDLLRGSSHGDAAISD